MVDLLSNTSRVETPFIIATMGGVSFGIYSKESKNIINGNFAYNQISATYPNFMKSLTVEKINGAANVYTLTMEYAITSGDDPNLVDKILSKASKDRKIVLSYGDLSLPNYIYKEEECMITKVSTNINVSGSSLVYTINCVSNSSLLSAGTFNFKSRVAKPSDVIMELIYDSKWGMLDIFYGMRDKDVVINKNLIARDDKAVRLEAKTQVTLLDYLSYLVSCMVSVGDSSDTIIKSGKYTYVVVDDTSNDFSGPYLKVMKMADNSNELNSPDMYTIDIGYPKQSMVTSFSVDSDETYALYLDYSEQIQQSNFIYRINDKGELVSEFSPTISNSAQLMKTTVADTTWWTRMTAFPITCTITLKGLLRPALLMTYVKINVLFYGRKHTSSGYYIVTKQTDSISDSGYRTTLRLTKIKGE